MNGIEKLTDEERDYLAQGGATQKRCTLAYKALRIIDQLTAALEAAERLRESANAQADLFAERARNLETQWRGAESRAEALQARVAELEAERDAARVIAGQSDEYRAAAESELATAKAHVAELEAAEKRAEHNAEGIEFWSMRYTAANDRAEALAAYLAGRPEASDHVAESELATAKARAAELEARVGAFMRVWHGADGGDTDEAINDAIDALSEVCNVKA